MTMSHPFDHTMNDLFAKLESAVKQRQEADIQITTNSAAIRALANTCEDEDAKGEYILRLEELSGKQGFADALRSVMKVGAAMKPTHIRDLIVLLKKMDLKGYSNPMSSIHTTLRRMKASGEVEELQNDKGEKVYRLTPEAQAASQAEIAEQKKLTETLSAAERFKLSTIRQEAYKVK
jgi:DNA-binding PadR family transcriptional regulator